MLDRSGLSRTLRPGAALPTHRDTGEAMIPRIGVPALRHGRMYGLRLEDGTLLPLVAWNETIAATIPRPGRSNQAAEAGRGRLRRQRPGRCGRGEWRHRGGGAHERGPGHRAG